jgi:uncharacterized membrane protein YphA (DoxX/SURF4 family)
MCWVRTLLNELPQWQWLGAFIARLAVGLLFFLAGANSSSQNAWNKCARLWSLREFPLPTSTQFLFPRSNSSFLLLILGSITPLACIMLGGVMIVAIATSAIRSIKAPPVLGWLSELFYLPEVLCLVILFWLFLSGPGWFSVDYLLFFR